MKFFQKRIPVLAIAAALALGFAFPNMTHAKPDFAKDGQRREMQLTAEQQTEFQKIREENRAATGETRKALDAKKAELATLMKSNSPDKNRIETLAKEIAGLRGELLIAKAQMRGKMKDAGLPDYKFAKKNPGKFDGKRDGKKQAPKFMTNLTDEQKLAARKIFEESKAATSDTRKALEAKKAELDTLLGKTPLDTARIEATAAEIGALQGQLLVARVDTREKLQQAGLPTDFPRKDFKAKDNRKDKKTPGFERSDRAGAQ